jgi:tRNA (cytidine/uridine-2'-O-)-methyltransferase
LQPRDRVVSPHLPPGAPLHLALVEPEIPPNAGNVARLCAATGCALHLIEPLGFRIDDRELKRAGLDYWDRVSVVVHPSLEAFLQVSAPAGRWFFSTRGTVRYADAPFTLGDVLIFGKETRGLPDELLARFSDRVLRLPMRARGVRSLNLSTAVGIAAYRALERLGFPDLH